MSGASNSQVNTNIDGSVYLPSVDIVNVPSSNTSNRPLLESSDQLPSNVISIQVGDFVIESKSTDSMDNSSISNDVPNTVDLNDTDIRNLIAHNSPLAISNHEVEPDNAEKDPRNFNVNVKGTNLFNCNEPLNLTCTKTSVLQENFMNNNNNNSQHKEGPNTEEKPVIHNIIPNDVKKEIFMEGDLDKIWKKELHFPTISTKNKKKIKTEKPQIYAISSEEWKKQQDEKLRQEEEKQKLKEFKKFERKMKRKIKQEEVEIKKKEKMKIKLLEEEKKKDYEAKVNMLLKEKAASLNINNYEPSPPVPKKRKVLKNITNNPKINIVPDAST